MGQINSGFTFDISADHCHLEGACWAIRVSASLRCFKTGIHPPPPCSFISSWNLFSWSFSNQDHVQTIWVFFEPSILYLLCLVKSWILLVLSSKPMMVEIFHPSCRIYRKRQNIQKDVRLLSELLCFPVLITHHEKRPSFHDQGQITLKERNNKGN